MNDIEKGIELKFSDNGVGIPSDEIGSIFHEFFRASNIKHKGYEGVGLGLTVVKQIFTKHGGTIRVESPSMLSDSTHPGTCFILTLPIL